VVTAATRVVLRGQQQPEAYVDLAAGTADEVGSRLAQRLAALDAELLEADPREPLPGFDLVVRGRRSWDERISRAAALVHR
jgi:hypothetical protein